MTMVWFSRGSSGPFTWRRSRVCVSLGPLVLLHKSWRLRAGRYENFHRGRRQDIKVFFPLHFFLECLTVCFLPCRCSGLLWGGDAHLVSGPAGRGADGSVQPRRARPPRHPAGQRRGPCRATPVVLRRSRHQQEAAAPALPEEGTPPVSARSQVAPN